MSGLERWTPFQVAELPDGVILARGALSLRLGGAGVMDVVTTVLSVGQGRPFDAQEALDRFAAPLQPAVGRLLDQLRRYRLLVPARDNDDAADETGEHVFFWDYRLGPNDVAARRAAGAVCVIGVNTVSRALVEALYDAETDAAPADARALTVLDTPMLRNLRLFDDTPALVPGAWPAHAPPPMAATDLNASTPEDALVVAVSDFGGAHALRPINQMCVRRGQRFLPVVLDRNVGFIGPMVLAGESPCYECLRARENANMTAPEVERAVEYNAFHGQLAKGAHPAMARALGAAAAFEVDMATTLHSLNGVGHLLEISLLAGVMVRRPVLRVPRCQVCSPLSDHPTMALSAAGSVDRTQQGR
jgi:bacteriocin biosynthesis cyclodehydratase domain-containing protein